MDPQTFDRLVRSLAPSASRRRVLAGLLGGALATVAGVPTGEAKRRHRRQHDHDATKDTSGNRDCAHFCQRVYPPGPDRGRCVSDAAHNQGVCRQCAADAGAVCCTRSAVGAACDPSQPIACCADGQTCQNGTCVAACTPDGGQCLQGSACCSGLCHAEAGICVSCIPNGDDTCTQASDCCVADVVCCEGRCCPAGRTCCPGQTCCDGPCCPSGSARSCCGDGFVCCPPGLRSACCPATSQCCASDTDCPGGQGCGPEGCCAG